MHHVSALTHSHYGIYYRQRNRRYVFYLTNYLLMRWSVHFSKIFVNPQWVKSSTLIANLNMRGIFLCWLLSACVHFCPQFFLFFANCIFVIHCLVAAAVPICMSVGHIEALGFAFWPCLAMAPFVVLAFKFVFLLMLQILQMVVNSFRLTVGMRVCCVPVYFVPIVVVGNFLFRH